MIRVYARVFFEENRSFLEDQNGQVQRANETLWFWLFLVLPQWRCSPLLSSWSYQVVLLHKPKKHCQDVHLYSMNLDLDWDCCEHCVVQGGLIHTTRGFFSRRSSFNLSVPACGEIEAIPVTVLCGMSTKRRHCSTQQTVRSTADLSKIDSTITSRLHPRIDTASS